MPRLLCLSGKLEGKGFPVRDRMRLGRLETCDVQIPDDDVSREHATLRRHEGGWAIHDLGSRNGLTVNGRRVKSAPLRNGDRVGIGDLVLLFEEEAAADAAPPAPSPPPEGEEQGEVAEGAEDADAAEPPRPRPLRGPAPAPARGFAFEAQLPPRQREVEAVLFAVVWALAFLCASAATQVLLRLIAV